MIRLPAAEDPAVSLIVLLDGAAELGERCLRAIATADDSIPRETVILLNDPDPELEALVRSTAGGKVVLARANAGPGVGWNLGAAVASAPRLMTLHEDSEPDPGWLAPLCEAMDETGAGAVGSRLYNDDGSVQNCGWVLFADASHQPITAAVAPEVIAATEPTPADMLSGAAMLIDREVVRAVGGWDERFHPAVFVDIDLSTAIWDLGRPVLSVPASSVKHASGTFDRRPNSALTGPRLRHFLFERNRHRFTAKWGPAMRDLAPPAADARPETIAAAVQAALPRTRERLERMRTGGPPGDDGPPAELRFTGLAQPPVHAGAEGFAVAPEVEHALRKAEAELIDEYHAWLIEREAEVTGLLAVTQDALEHRERDVDDLNQHIAAVRTEYDQLAAAYNRRPLRRVCRGAARLLRRRSA